MAESSADTNSRNAASDSFSMVSERTGTKAAFEAPSPTRSRSMLGNRNATMNASRETPGTRAVMVMSRTRPSTRLIIVPPANTAANFESCWCDAVMGELSD